MGRTVVEPLIFMVCFWPVETGAVVVTGAAVVDTAPCVVTNTVGDAVGAGIVVVPLPVHPAANASMNTAARLRKINKYELCFPFMVFHHPSYAT
jgi:hypothetical protein